MTVPATIAELGEFGLIERIRRRIDGGFAGSGDAVASDDGTVLGIGDDAAILRPEPGWDLVVTCDAQVAGRHFVPAWMTPRAIGRRAMTVNLSDIAAMGAEPRYALISLGLPKTMTVDFVDGLYDGFLDALAGPGGRIIGGNLTGCGEEWFCDITLIGRVEAGAARRRSGARPGDRIFCTGSPGRAAAGLAVLRAIEVGEGRGSGGSVRNGTTPMGDAPSGGATSGAAASGRASSDGTSSDAITRFEARHPWAEPLIRAFLEPQARVAAGRVLARLDGVSAVIDLSDGLAGDLTRICEQSGVSARVDPNRFPADPALEAAARFFGRPRPDWTTMPGDDYELLLCLHPEAASGGAGELASALGLPVAEIGVILSPGPERIAGIQATGGEGVRSAGWDHFAG